MSKLINVAKLSELPVGALAAVIVGDTEILLANVDGAVHAMGNRCGHMNASLAAGSDEAPGVLRERVTSKGGTTEAALKSFAADGFPAIVQRAVAAAEARGRELGDQLGQD